MGSREDTRGSDEEQHDNQRKGDVAATTAVAATTGETEEPDQAEQERRTRFRTTLAKHPFDKNWLLSLPSLLSFTWVSQSLREGSRRQLTMEDMFALPSFDKPRRCLTRIEKLWDPSKTRSYLSCVIRAEKWSVAFAALVFLLEAGFQVAEAILLGQIALFFEGYADSPDTADLSAVYLYAMGIAILAFLHGAAHHVCFFLAQKAGHTLRTGTIALVYKKALRLDTQSTHHLTTGHIMTLVSNDVERFFYAMPYVNFVWIGPLQVAVAGIFLYRLLGVYCFFGLGFIVLSIPAHIYTSKFSGRFRKRTAEITDQRVRIMGELLAGIRVIKMYVWEKPFQQLIGGIRKKEIGFVKKSQTIKAVNLAYFFFAHSLIAYISFAPYVYAGNTLTAYRVFTSLALFGVVQLNMGLFFPASVHSLSELRITCRRIEKYLRIKEHPFLPPAENAPDNSGTTARPSGRNGDDGGDDGGDDAVVATNVDVDWGRPGENGSAILQGKGNTNGRSSNSSNSTRAGESQLTLQHVSFRIRRGSLVGIVGPVGAGKSTLFMTILRELTPLSGTICVNGAVSFTSQEAWILATTLRENVLFGKPFDEAKYNRVIDVCGLRDDLKQLPSGDMTFIGERGVTLSGGQKARLSLARCVYRAADIYLLDDPLCAVDAKVGHQIYNECVKGFLKGKTRLLATHQVHHLVDADTILVFDEHGSLVGQGTYHELLEAECEVFVNQVRQDRALGPRSRATSLQETKPDAGVPTQDSRDEDEDGDGDADEDDAEGKTSTSKEELEEEEEGVGSTLFATEDRYDGKVTRATYTTYLRLMGSVPIIICTWFLVPAVQGIYIGVDVSLARWVNEDEAQRDRDSLFTRYSILLFAMVIFSIVRAILLQLGLVRASRVLHDRMFSAVMRSPIRFFDTNPVGRILNRFSKDLGFMDDLLPWATADFISLFTSILGTVILASVINPWIFLISLPVSVLFVYLRQYYLRAARDIKRLEAVSRSPLYSHFSLSLAGLSTIRAHQAEEKAVDTLLFHQDDHGKAAYMFLCASRWLGFRLDFLVFVFVTCVTFGAIAARDVLDPGLVGLSLVYVLKLTGGVQWCVRQSAEVENFMTSVERAIEYSQLTPEDALAEKWIREKREGHRRPPTAADHGAKVDSMQPIPQASSPLYATAPKYWPEIGTVVFKNVTLRYDDSLPPVIKGINLTVSAGMKVGIVGRTGAGKSSIIAALFRLAKVEGCLLIDGIDITLLPFDTFRKHISVIPQDPILFSGSVRYNLDPFNSYTDAELWSSLETVQLKKKISGMDGGLEAAVQENGSNFSVGQKQLMCLARALLRHSKIIVIDEATANVDKATDDIIQQTIRKIFASNTVFTIAHRLQTIMDADRILVMDAGRVAEFAAPHELLARDDSHLSALVAQLNRHAQQQLRDIANKAKTRQEDQLAVAPPPVSII